jgi:hypothetical protein
MTEQKNGAQLVTRPRITKISAWLKDSRKDNPAQKYRHLLLVEQTDKRDEVIGELVKYFDFAHEPARRQIRSFLGGSLDPLSDKLTDDPARGYPEDLHAITLQGYLGEVFAGIIAEYYDVFGATKWEVPVFLFHTHNVAFQQLELVRQTGKKVTKVPGRTGDDCLAFERDGKGNILRILFCEAKCTKNHDKRMIADAHTKLSSKNILPVDLPRVIEALRLISDGDQVEKWINALLKIYLNKELVKERCDMSVYMCGNPPRRKDTHISTQDTPSEYTGNRKLTAVEVHANDIEQLVKNVYDSLKISQ